MSKMSSPLPEGHQEVSQGLLSSETLDRSSPELWPEKVPGLTKYCHSNPQVKVLPNSQTWAEDLDSDDINLVHQFGSLTTAGLISEVKKLCDVAYQLGLDEMKELTRGKYLNILPTKKH